MENEPEQLLGKILQEHQQDPTAVSRKEESLLTSQEQLLLLFQPSHPRSPLGPAKPEAAWASASTWSGAPQLVLAVRALGGRLHPHNKD